MIDHQYIENTFNYFFFHETLIHYSYIHIYFTLLDNEMRSNTEDFMYLSHHHIILFICLF